MKSTRLNHKKLYLIGLVTMASFMVTTSSAMEQINTSSNDVLASVPQFTEDFDPSNFARYQLALPNMEAQKNISAEIKLAMGLKPGQPVPIRPQYGVNLSQNVLAIKECLNQIPYSKSVTIKDGQLFSTVFGSNNNENTDLLPNFVYLYVVGEDGNMYALPEDPIYREKINENTKLLIEKIKTLKTKCIPKANLFFHKMVFGAKNVISAGEIVVEDGKITRIDVDSGHYRASVSNLCYGIRILQDKNIFAPNTDVAFRDSQNVTQTLELKAFLEQKPWVEQSKKRFSETIEYLCENKNYFSINAVYPFKMSDLDKETIIEKIKTSLVKEKKITLEKSLLASPFKKYSPEEEHRKEYLRSVILANMILLDRDLRDLLVCEQTLKKEIRLVRLSIPLEEDDLASTVERHLRYKEKNGKPLEYYKKEEELLQLKINEYNANLIELNLKLNLLNKEITALNDQIDKADEILKEEKKWEYSEELEKEYNSVMNDFATKAATSYKEKQEKYARRFKEIPAEKHIDVLREIVGEKMKERTKRLTQKIYEKLLPEEIKQKRVIILNKLGFGELIKKIGKNKTAECFKKSYCKQIHVQNEMQQAQPADSILQKGSE